MPLCVRNLRAIESRLAQSPPFLSRGASLAREPKWRESTRYATYRRGECGEGDVCIVSVGCVFGVCECGECGEGGECGECGGNKKCSVRWVWWK